jgi:plastocyanin
MGDYVSSFRPFWLILALVACSDSTDPVDGNSVAMTSSNTFSPSSVTIAATEAVTWTNGSGTAHNVTFGQVTGAPANVPDFTNGSQSRTFPTAGTFPYQCTIHAGMTGQVIVQ